MGASNRIGLWIVYCMSVLPYVVFPAAYIDLTDNTSKRMDSRVTVAGRPLNLISEQEIPLTTADFPKRGAHVKNISFETDTLNNVLSVVDTRHACRKKRIFGHPLAWRFKFDVTSNSIYSFKTVEHHVTLCLPQTPLAVYIHIVVYDCRVVIEGLEGAADVPRPVTFPLACDSIGGSS